MFGTSKFAWRPQQNVCLAPTHCCPCISTPSPDRIHIHNSISSFFTWHWHSIGSVLYALPCVQHRALPILGLPVFPSGSTSHVDNASAGEEAMDGGATIKHLGIFHRCQCSHVIISRSVIAVVIIVILIVVHHFLGHLSCRFSFIPLIRLASHTSRIFYWVSGVDSTRSVCVARTSPVSGN